VVRALPNSFASVVTVPTGSILTLMAIASLAGVIAAWLPARRAGRLDVLDAIATS
jgi:putative ABC transport system permease protein